MLEEINYKTINNQNASDLANTDKKTKVLSKSLDYLKSAYSFWQVQFFFITPQTKHLGEYLSNYSPVGSIRTDK